jgi:hypothetical protein
MKIMDKPMGLQTIVLGKKHEIQWLSRFLPKELGPVSLLETTREIDRLPVAASPRLIVAIDSFPGGINLSLLQKIKMKLNAVAMICLVSNISEEMEIELRSAGLVFLGSHQSFLSHAEEIIGNACKCPVSPRMEKAL